MAYVHLVRFSLKCFFRCGYELSLVDSLLHTQRLARRIRTKVDHPCATHCRPLIAAALR